MHRATDSLSLAGKDALIGQLLARVDVMSHEAQVMSARLLLMEASYAALQAENAQLRAKLDLPPKTPDNSSIPPSRGQKEQGADKKAGDKKAGSSKRKSHPGAHRPLHPDPTSRRDVKADACEHCQADVSAEPQAACEAYDHVEIPPVAPEITRVTLFGGTCPCCARKFKAAAPAGMAQGSPYGSNLRALVIHLRFTQGIALERLKTLMRDLWGLDISEGAILNILNAAQQPFIAQVNLIRARLLSGTALESDETGMRVIMRNWWLWVFHHGKNAVFEAEPSRSKKVVADFLGEFRPDFWVSDRYCGQLGWAGKANQVCLAHLIRDTQFVIDSGDTVFAPGLRHLLGRACWLGQRRDKLDDTMLAKFTAHLDARLDRLLDLKPTHPAGVKFQGVIRKFRPHMFVFMANRAIPPTNNGSERALRPCVTFRKITNGFRTEWGVKFYADVRSVIETARRHGISAFEAIRLTLNWMPLQPMAP